MTQINGGAGETLEKRSHFRWTVCALLFAATTVNYLDRQVLGILAPHLQKIFGWSEVEYGYIVTAFQMAYALGLALFGRFIDKFGTKIGYAAALVIWSIAAMAHAARPLGLRVSGLARFALGLGESGNFPSAIKAVAEWFPRKERALATGIFNAGSNVGAVIAPAVVPWITIQFGWPAAFIATGAIGFLWLFFWFALYEIPEKKKGLGRAELAHILSDPAEPAPEKISLARSPPPQADLGDRPRQIPDGPDLVVLSLLAGQVPSTRNSGCRSPRSGPPLIVIYLIDRCRKRRRRLAVIGAHQKRLDGEPQPQSWSCSSAPWLSVPVMTAPGASQLWTAVLLIGAGGRRPSGLVGQYLHLRLGYVSQTSRGFGYGIGRHGRRRRRHLIFGGGRKHSQMDGKLLRSSSSSPVRHIS